MVDYIYIDESGDLGKSSKYYVIVAVKLSNPILFDKLIKKTYRKFSKKIGKSNEVKGNKFPKVVKENLLINLNSIDCEFYGIIFDKKYKYKLNCSNNEKSNILASELAKIIRIGNSTNIFIDKFKNKQSEINKYNQLFLKNLESKKYTININHVNSLNYKGLQIADLIAWSLFQSVENSNKNYINLIKKIHLKKVFED